MTDLIKSHLTKSFLEFIMDYGDPSSINKKEIQDRCICDIGELFHRQINADKSKKRLGKEKFNDAIALYLNKFNTPDGIDAFRLRRDLNLYAPIMEIHLGKMAMKYLNLLAQVSLAIDEKPKGLMAV